jgi:hypothetical protein
MELLLYRYDIQIEKKDSLLVVAFRHDELDHAAVLQGGQHPKGDLRLGSILQL